MNYRLVLGIFDEESAVVNATSEANAEGFDIIDVFTPYAVHGLDHAMGLKRSRLPWVAFVFGMFGVAFMLWFQYWTSTVSWAIDVGGRPWNSLPAFFPVVFETAVLFAGLSIVAALLIRCGLYPGKSACSLNGNITNDQFILVVNISDGNQTVQDVEQLCNKHNVVRVVERCEHASTCTAQQGLEFCDGVCVNKFGSHLGSLFGSMTNKPE